MRAGCQQSQGGAYPAFQDQSNVCALTSLQDSNATSIPGVHLATGMQYNMVATYSKTETYSPAQWQQGYTQSQQNFQGLYQLDPQASTTFTGFQHPEPRNSIWISQNSHQQVHRKANPVRQSGYNGGQHRECSSTKGSNLNIDTGLQPRLELNVGSPDGTSSATLRGVQGDSLRVAAQTFPTQTLCSRREMIIQKHSLLTSLLKGNPPDDRYFATTPSSKDTNAKIGRNTNTLSSNERFDKIQHVRSSPTHNGRKTTPQNLDHLGRTHSTPCQQQVSALLRSESYPEVFPVEESQPPTDDDIQAFILRSFEDFRTNGKNGLIPLHSNSTPQPGCIPKSNSTAHVSTNFISGKDDMDLQILDCAVKEQGITAIGQIFEEDHMKGSKVKAELTPMSEKMSDCATSASKKHSTGTLASAVGNSKHASKTESTERAMMGLDSSVNKQLDVSKTTQHIGKPFHSSDCKDKTFDSCNNEIFHSILSNKYLDAGEITLRGSLTALKELIACPENVETIAEMDKCPKVILQRHWNGDIDNIHLFASTEYPPILGKVAATCMKNEDEGPVIVNAVPPVTLDGLTEKHHTSLLIIKGDANLKPVQAVWLGSVQGVTDVSEHLQTQSSTVVSDKETSEATTHIENQDPEENTDDQKHCNITCTGVNAQCKENALADIRIHNVVSMASHQGEHLYNHTSHVGAREDPRSLYQQSDALVPLNENKVKGQASLSKGVGQELLCVRDPKYDDISDDDHMSQLATEPPVLEREDLSFPACYEDISDAGSPDVENGSAERQSVTQVPEPNKKQSSFENEKYGHVQCQVLKDDDDEDDDDDDDDWIVIPVCMSDLKFEPEGKYCESPDDSGDDAEETQSDTALMHRDPHQSSHSYKIPEFNTIESFKRHYRAQFQMDFKVELQNRGESDSEAEESSDTEDSCDYTSGSECNKLTASRQLWLEGSATDDTGSGKKDEDGQNRSLNNLGPIQKLKQLIKPSTASNNVQNQTSEPKISKEDEVIVIDDDTDSELDQSSCSDNSKHSPGSQQKRHSPDTVGGETVKRIKSNGDSDNEQHYGQGSETIIILDCDTDDDKDQDYNKTNRKSLSPSASAEGDAPCLEQMIHPPQTVSIIHETTEETSLSVGSSLLRPQSKYDTQLEEALEDAGPDLSHSKGKHGQLIKTKDGPGHVQHKSSRSRMSEQRVNTKRQLSSEEANSDKAVFSTKRRRSAEAVDCQQGNGEILAPKATAGTSKKIESSEKNIRHSHRKERGSFVSKAKPDSDKHSTKNKGQTSVEKSRLSSPSQTSPSTLFSSPSSTSRDRKSGQELEEVLRSTHNGLHKVARPGPGRPEARPGPGPGRPEARPVPGPGRPEARPVPGPGRPEARPGPGPGRPEARPGPGPGRPKARPGPGPGRPKARPGPGPGRPKARPGPGPGRPKARPGPGPSHSEARPRPGPSHSEARPGPGPSHSEARPGPGPSHSEARPGPGPSHSEARPGPGPSHSEARPGPGPSHSEARPGPGPSHSEARPGPGPHRPVARPGPGPHRPEARPGPGPHRPEARPGPGPHRPEARPGPGPHRPEARTGPGPKCHEARPGPSYCEARPLPKRRERRSRLCHKDGRKSHQRESAPRQRHISVHPLMERSKCDAVQWTKAITRDSVRKQRYSVPDGYRGAENPEVDEPEFDY